MEPVTMAAAAAAAAPAAAAAAPAAAEGASALASFLPGASSAAPAAGGAEAIAAPESAGIMNGGEITDATSAEFEAAEVTGMDTMGTDTMGEGKSDFFTRFKEGWNSGKSSGGKMPPMVDQSHPTSHIAHVADAGAILAQLARH